jgi:hypothetical protein
MPTATRMGTVLGVLAVGLLAMPSVSGAAPQPPRPLQDSVTATEVEAQTCGPLEITAQSGPSGENATGQVFCAGLFSGPVTCLSVSGNVALLLVESTGDLRNDRPEDHRQRNV